MDCERIGINIHEAHKQHTMQSVWCLLGVATPNILPLCNLT